MTLLPSPDRVIAWPYLTSVARKRAAYAIESYFRQALWDAKLVCGDRLYPVLQRLTFTVFKPESFAGRRVDTALQFLHRQNYRPITCFPLTLTRHMLNEMWRYQWNAATIDKMEVGIRLNCGRPTQLVFWYDDSDSPELPD